MKYFLAALFAISFNAQATVAKSYYCSVGRVGGSDPIVYLTVARGERATTVMASMAIPMGRAKAQRYAQAQCPGVRNSGNGVDPDYSCYHKATGKDGKSVDGRTTEIWLGLNKKPTKVQVIEYLKVKNGRSSKIIPSAPVELKCSEENR